LFQSQKDELETNSGWFAELPRETWLLIVTNLDYPSILILNQVCWFFYITLSSSLRCTFAYWSAKHRPMSDLILYYYSHYKRHMFQNQDQLYKYNESDIYGLVTDHSQSSLPNADLS